MKSSYLLTIPGFVCILLLLVIIAVVSFQKDTDLYTEGDIYVLTEVERPMTPAEEFLDEYGLVLGLTGLVLLLWSLILDNTGLESEWNCKCGRRNIIDDTCPECGLSWVVSCTLDRMDFKTWSPVKGEME